MNLISNIWYAASKDKIVILDILRNLRVQPNEIMNYTIFDSVEVVVPIDSIYPYRYKIAGDPVQKYLTNSIEISQDWFYNKTKNFFYSIIKEVFLYALILNRKSKKKRKRFKVIFK